MSNPNQRDVRRSSAAVVALVAGGTFGIQSEALGGPQGAQVQNGQVSIASTGNLTTITASNNAIINYQSFDIAGHETVRFIQPNASARVLNRVMSNAPTQINGALLANGQVFLVNPAGVTFGARSSVNVAGLFAAAGDITNADFVSGVNRFSNIQGGVTAQGFITADAVHLIGRTVANHGTIVSNNGLVTLLAGDEVYLRERGERISVEVSADQIAGQSAGRVVGAAIENTGSIDAGAGRITLGAGDAASLAIRNTGRLAAAGGEISISSPSAGVFNSGEIDVGGGGRSVEGGTISLSGGGILNQGTIATGPGGSVSAAGNVGDVLLVSDIITPGGDVVIETSGSILFGLDPASDGQGVSSTTSLRIEGDTISLAAGGEILDRVVDVFDPSVLGTVLGGENTTEITLTADSGRVEFGTVEVADDGLLRITQSATRVQGDSSILNGENTNVVVRVTDGDLTFERAAGGGADDVIRLRSLSGTSDRGGVTVATRIETGAGLTLLAAPELSAGGGARADAGDVTFEADVVSGGDLFVEAGRDILFGSEFVAPDFSTLTPSLLIDGATVTMIAGRTFQDRVVDIFDPSSVGTVIGSLGGGGIGTSTIDLTASMGRVAYGRANVVDNGFVSITQRESRAQGDFDLGNALATNLRVRVTHGDLVLEQNAGGQADSQIGVRTLLATSDIGDVIVRENTDAALFGSLSAGNDVIFENDFTTGGAATVTAGRDIVFGTEFLAPDVDTITGDLFIDGTSVTMTAGRTFEDRIVDLSDPASNGVRIGSLADGVRPGTTDVTLTAEQGRVAFGRATVVDGGAVRVTQSESRAQGDADLGNADGTNLFVRVTEGDLVLEQNVGGQADGLIRVLSLDASADVGDVTVRTPVESLTTANVVAGTDIVVERDLVAGEALTADAARDVVFGAEFLEPDLSTITPELLITGETVDIRAGRTFEDRVLDAMNPVGSGTRLGTREVASRPETASIELLAEDGRVDFGVATVIDGGLVRITQSDTRFQSDNDLGNAAGTNLDVTVTGGDLFFDQSPGVAVDGVIGVLSLSGESGTGDVVTRTEIVAGETVGLVAARDVVFEGDVSAGGAATLDAGRDVVFGRDPGGVATASVQIDAASIDANAARTFDDRTLGGAALGSVSTSVVDLFAGGGTTDFGVATVGDGGLVRLTQTDELTLDASAIGNAGGTNLVIDVTEANARLGGTSFELASLNVDAATGIIVDANVDAVGSIDLASSGVVTLRNDLMGGAGVAIDGLSVRVGGGSVVELAGPSVSVSAPIDAETGADPAGLSITGDAVVAGSVGETAALSSLVISGSVDLGGDTVTTTGDQTFGGALLLAQDAVLTAGDGGTITFAEIESNTGAGFSAVVGEDGLVVFNGNLGSATGRLGDVVVSTSGAADAARPGVPDVATIGFTNGAEIFVDSFRVNRNEKITSLGDLVLDSLGTVEFGDVNVLGDLRVDASELVLLRRDGGSALRPDGSSATDGGVDVAASGSIEIDALLTLGGSPNGATPRLGAGGLISISGADNVTQSRLDGDEVTVGTLVAPDGTLLDIVVSAPGNPGDGPDTIEGGELIDQRNTEELERDFVDELVLDILIAALDRIGVPTRGLTDAELAQAADGFYLASDLPATRGGYGSGGAILASRIDRRAAAQLVQRYEALFGPTSEDRTGVVASTVMNAAFAYMDATGSDRMDPRGFAEWAVAEAPGGASRATVDALADLLERINGIGLTEAEYRVARVAFVEPLVAEGAPYSAEELAEAIERAAAAAQARGTEGGADPVAMR